MKRTQREIVNRGGVAYTVATWDDETGDSEILLLDSADSLLRRCVRTYLPESEQWDAVIGEAVWFNSHGVELERQPLRAQPSDSPL